ncbi:hypothetical protein EV356DRAFT_283457 [Viridothelium virens]|uniref:DNA recombination and repair protein Rad51-like C-terminal domain-containing protein n=1 Tax=Viridothelium virens TaxID=1048519 RepID=A0A6A6H0Z2_VIRVR|nr:hypothetical protein EV356DRAFT_283457 [Viridothelium virens]
MSAQDLGKRLLNEVIEEKLDEALQSLHALHHRSRPFTGINHIDNVLHKFRPGDSLDFDLDALDVQGTHPPKPAIIEIESPDPSQGKTQLLYFLTATIVLPTIDATSQVILNGQNGAVVVLDTDSRFSVSRLAQVMQFYISLHRTPQRVASSRRQDLSPQQIIDHDDDTAFIQMCLKHVHIFYPQSFESLLATLHSLEEYLLNFDKHTSASRPLSAIILDSASAFYWQERRKREDAKLSIHQRTNDPSLTQTIIKTPQLNDYAQLRQTLKMLMKSFACPVIITTDSNTRHLLPQSHEAILTPELSHPWLAFPKVRLLIRKPPIDKFPPAHSVQEAFRDKLARQEVVNQGRFEILLKYRAAEAWREGLESAPADQTICLPVRVGDEGVWVSDGNCSSDNWLPWLEFVGAE